MVGGLPVSGFLKMNCVSQFDKWKGKNTLLDADYLKLVCCSEPSLVSAQKVVAAWAGVSHLKLDEILMRILKGRID